MYLLMLYLFVVILMLLLIRNSMFMSVLVRIVVSIVLKKNFCWVMFIVWENGNVRVIVDIFIVKKYYSGVCLLLLYLGVLMGIMV